MRRTSRHLQGSFVFSESTPGLRAPAVRPARDTLLPAERRGLRLVHYGLIAIAVLLGLRLTNLQTFARGYYLQVAEELYPAGTPKTVPPGRILDQRGRALAVAEPVADISANPSVFHSKDADPEALRRCLTSTLKLSPERVEALFNSTAAYAPVARLVPLSVADKVAAQNLKGLSIERTYRRAYPHGKIACHLLGGYTRDQRPRTGLDLRYAFALRGQPGAPGRNLDAWGRQIIGWEGAEGVDPVPARDVVTTLDLDVQRQLDAALDALMSTHRPASASGLVIEPRSGAILAMAARPAYDPNQFSVRLEDLRNPSVNWVYEPGSTFKVLCAAAALDSGAITPNTTFSCPSTMQIGGRPLRNWRLYPGVRRLNAAQILAESNNLGAAQMALRVGAQRYVRFLRACGLGAPTRVGLPGEEAGILRSVDSLRTRDVANMGFGQSVLVTPLQLLAAIGAIVNDGKYMQPQIVRQVLNADGSLYREVPPLQRATVCSPETSRLLRRMMTGVVEQGTGARAKIPGFAVGGKTGTAQVWNPQLRAFDSSQSIVSFVLVAPSDRVPDFAILIVAKDPQVGQHGSEVAAPAARQVAHFMLHRQGVEPGTGAANRDRSHASPHDQD